MDLEDLVQRAGGEILNLEKPVKTVEQAVEASGFPKERIVKSIVLMSREGPILVVARGESRVSFKKLREIVGKVRMAKPEEVLKITGYEVGSVPPVGVDIRTIVDRRVLENDYVLGGGGSHNRLLKIDPGKIVEYQKAEVLDVTE